MYENADYLDEEKTLVNFEKMQLIEAKLSEIERYQGSTYDLLQEDNLYAYLYNAPYLDEEVRHKKSLICEPPQTPGINFL